MTNSNINDYVKKQSRKKRKTKLKKQTIHSIQTISQLWQTVFFSCLSAILVFFLINNGWKKITIDQIHISGNRIFKKEEIIKAFGVDFPKPLLRVFPKEIESNLIKELSFEAVSVRRQILPSRLLIEVFESEPIAYAQRKGPKGPEKGLVDQNAKWIPANWQAVHKSQLSVYINGWRYSHREFISLILLNRGNLGSPLEEIILTSTGETTLKTNSFDIIKLGDNPNLLTEQIKVLSYLQRSLPSRFVDKSGITLDLTDPSKPELQTGMPY